MLQDTGVGVRKRVIKLMKSFYDVISDRDQRIDICSKIVYRVTDDDDGVKDLAVKTVEELWFNSSNSGTSSKSRSSSDVVSQDKSQLLGTISIIMGVCAVFKERQASLEEVLYKIMSDKEANSDASPLLARYKEICEALIDGLVDDSDIPGFVSDFLHM
jgi:cohesin loading factor subunit SCC2